MVADCRSRLAVRPHAGRAVLFYSQHPNGEEDTSSLHGGSFLRYAAIAWSKHSIPSNSFGFDFFFFFVPKVDVLYFMVKNGQYVHKFIIISKISFHFSHARNQLLSSLHRQTIGYGMDHEEDSLEVQSIRNLRERMKTLILDN